MADIEKFVYYSNGSKKVLKPTDRIVIGPGESDGNGGYLGGLAFEGATSNDFETTLKVADPTDDRTITFPDEDGDVALLQGDSLPKALSFPVKNPSTTTALTKGQIVYISGHSGNKPEVSLAQSNSSATMPAFGFVQNDIAAEAEGYVVYSGLFKGIDTNTAYSEGDTLYVSSTSAGEFQNTPPAGSNLIQNIGKIVKSDASNGEVLVGGAGRTNATPNLDEGKFFIGGSGDDLDKSIQSNYKLPTTLTSNAILVASSDGSSILSTDLLTIDTTSDRVGIGTSSPARTLHLVGDVQYEGSMRIDQYHNSVDGPDVLMQKSRGTPSTPAASQDGDELGKFVFYGHDGTSFQESASFVVTDNGSQGAEIQLKTTASGGTSPSERFEINSSGIITFNNAYSFPTSDGTSGQILQTDGNGTLTFEDASSGAMTVETKTANFAASPNYFYLVSTTAGNTISVTIPYAGNFSFGDRIKVFNTGPGVVKLLEEISGTSMDPSEGTSGVYGSYRNINSKGLVELVATSTSNWSYVIIPQLELDESSLTQSGEVFAYDSTELAMKALPYTFPSSDGSANQLVKTDGSGALSFVDPVADYLKYTDLSGDIATADFEAVNYRQVYGDASRTINLPLVTTKYSYGYFYPYPEINNKVMEIVNESQNDMFIKVSDSRASSSQNYSRTDIYDSTGRLTPLDGNYTYTLGPCKRIYLSIRYSVESGSSTSASMIYNIVS